MNFQYLEDLDFEFPNSDFEFPNSSFEFEETVLSLNEGNVEKSSSCEGKA